MNKLDMEKQHALNAKVDTVILKETGGAPADLIFGAVGVSMYQFEKIIKILHLIDDGGISMIFIDGMRELCDMLEKDIKGE